MDKVAISAEGPTPATKHKLSPTSALVNRLISSRSAGEAQLEFAIEAHMAPLPVFNKHPLSSALAIMAFPNDEEKAYLCSCWIIVKGMPDVLINHQQKETAAHIASRSSEFAECFPESDQDDSKE
jgi:hypothetical protein